MILRRQIVLIAITNKRTSSEQPSNLLLQHSIHYTFACLAKQHIITIQQTEIRRFDAIKKCCRPNFLKIS